MTITVRLPDELEAELRAKLGVQQIDPEDAQLLEFVRQAIAEKLAHEPAIGQRTGKPSAYELGKHLFGKYSSGRTDVSVNKKKYVREAILAKHRRQTERDG